MITGIAYCKNITNAIIQKGKYDNSKIRHSLGGIRHSFIEKGWQMDYGGFAGTKSELWMIPGAHRI